MNYDQLVEKLKSDLSSTFATKDTFHWPSWTYLLILGVLLLLLAGFLASTFYTVRTQKFRIVERFGKYLKTAEEGLHFRIPLVDKVHPDWSLKIFQLMVIAETITKDKVTVVLTIPVQFNITPGREAMAFYKLDDVNERIKAVVFDITRSMVPKLTLDEVFNSKETLAGAAQEELRKNMEPFGYSIDQLMITEVEPEEKVKSAMNEIDAEQKLGEAQLAKAHNEQQVQVARARGRLEAAKLNKEAEIIDAEAVAASIKIIEGQLGGPEGFLRWKWIEMMDGRDAGDTIYVPTEGSLPILEASREALKEKPSKGSQVIEMQS